jgi:peptidoglycan/LPS O-acetylase OafA/YrhL
MKYIPEVDGIRAVAVLSVVLYHLGFAWAHGGFIGVDIFFVISGYLITSIVKNDLENNAFSFKKFYARRMLRILPALYVTLFGTAIVFLLLFPPLVSTDLLTTLYSALLSYSNFLFYYTVDYFGENVTKPTLHIWSLAVEEQFYLFLPLIFWLAWKKGQRNLSIAILAGILFLSLFSSGHLAEKNQSMVFYFPWLRAWELLAGSLLAFVHVETMDAHFKRVLSEAGLILLVAGSFFYDDKMVFPGYAALLPVFGTSALLFGAGSGSVANKILRLGSMQWIGKISYSLYLVHWPIICLVSLMFSMSTIKYQATVLAIGIVVAWFSWRMIETPFRRMTGHVAPSNVFLVAGLSTAGTCALFIALYLSGEKLWENFPQAVKYSQALSMDTSFFNKNTCFLTAKSDGIQYFKKDVCLKLSTDKKNVLVIGDSHAANIVEALKIEFPSINFMQATAVGCRPTLESTGAARCTDLVNFIYKDWLKKNSDMIDRVIIAGRWELGDVKSLNTTISHLTQLGVKTVLYGPTPEYMVSVPLILAYEDIGKFSLSPTLVRSDRRKIDEEFRKNFSGTATYFSPFNTLCMSGNCIASSAGEAIFFDRDHFTRHGAAMVIKGMPLY